MHQLSAQISDASVREHGGDVALLLAALHDPAHVAVPPWPEDDLAGDRVVDVAEELIVVTPLRIESRNVLGLVEVGSGCRCWGRGRAPSGRAARPPRRRPAGSCGPCSRTSAAGRRSRACVLGCSVTICVVVEEHRDAEVLDHVVLAGRVVRRLQELGSRLLQVRDQRLVQLHQLAPRAISWATAFWLGTMMSYAVPPALQLGQQLVVATSSTSRGWSARPSPSEAP